MPGEDVSEFDTIIDLTAEFPRWYRPANTYLCIPNLDGVAVVDLGVDLQLEDAGQVLIHCAQGHGRSATLAALLLGNSTSQSAEEVLAAIRQARPAVEVSRAQFRQLLG